MVACFAKRPGDLLAAAPRLAVDSHFHVICLIRDPRDVVVSRHGKDHDKYWVPPRVWTQRLPVLRALAARARVTELVGTDSPFARCAALDLCQNRAGRAGGRCDSWLNPCSGLFSHLPHMPTLAIHC